MNHAKNNIKYVEYIQVMTSWEGDVREYLHNFFIAFFYSNTQFETSAIYMHLK